MKIGSLLPKIAARVGEALLQNLGNKQPAPPPPPDRFERGNGKAVDWKRHPGRLDGAAAPTFPQEKAERVVAALYRGVLGREPDASGLETYVPMVAEGRLADVVDAVLGSPEFAGRVGAMTLESLSADLYEGILGRAPDPDGDAATRACIHGGRLAARVFDMLLSPEHQGILDAPPSTPTPPSVPTPTPPSTPTPPTTPAPREPGPALSTVPWRPEFSAAPIDTSSPEKAVLSAAQWVKDVKPEWFQVDDRQVCFDMMTWVIGALRAHGYDAHRVVNHPSHPIGNGWRYGSDALVLEGKVYDAYRGIGDPNASVPQAMYVGDYARDRLRE